MTLAVTLTVEELEALVERAISRAQLGGKVSSADLPGTGPAVTLSVQQLEDLVAVAASRALIPYANTSCHRGRSNLPNLRRLYRAEDAWWAQRQGGTIAASDAVYSRLIPVESLAKTGTGQLFLSTDPPIIEMAGDAYVPREAYDPFREAVQSIVDVQVRRIRTGFHKRELIADEERQRTSTVYFVRSETTGHIKIGFTLDVKTRVRELQCAHGGKLHVIGTIKGGRDVEKELHKQFAALRLHGEWFMAATPLTEYVSGLERADS